MITMESMYALSAIGMPGWQEMIVFGIVALVIFGPKRLPALSRSLGKSITDFKKGLHDIKGDFDEAGREVEAEVEAEAEKEAKAKKEDEGSLAGQTPPKD